MKDFHSSVENKNSSQHSVTWAGWLKTNTTLKYNENVNMTLSSLQTVIPTTAIKQECNSLTQENTKI